MPTPKYWTTERLEVMREILRRCYTVEEALAQGRRHFRRDFSPSGLGVAFRAAFGGTLGDFLKRRTYSPPETPADRAALVSKLVRAAQQRPRTMEEVCDDLELLPRDARALVLEAQAAGHTVQVDNAGLLRFVGLEPRHRPTVVKFPKVERVLHLAVISDTHFGSRKARKEELRNFMHRAYELGCRWTLHAGDVLDGDNMWRGHRFELEAHGFDQQADLALDHEVGLPHWPDHKYLFITGNHDESLHRSAGLDVGRALVYRGQEQGREDLIYLGHTDAMVHFVADPQKARKGSRPGVRVELIHPDGGGAYAISYKLQKLIEGIPSGTKPQVLVQGHEHSYCHISTRAIEAFKPGCFEDQTPYMLRKRLTPDICGLVLECHLAGDGSLRELVPRKITYPYTRPAASEVAA